MCCEGRMNGRPGTEDGRPGRTNGGPGTEERRTANGSHGFHGWPRITATTTALEPQMNADERRYGHGECSAQDGTSDGWQYKMCRVRRRRRVSEQAALHAGRLSGRCEWPEGGGMPSCGGARLMSVSSAAANRRHLWELRIQVARRSFAQVALAVRRPLVVRQSASSAKSVDPIRPLFVRAICGYGPPFPRVICGPENA
jgi:hypothetical protein